MAAVRPISQVPDAHWKNAKLPAKDNWLLKEEHAIALVMPLCVHTFSRTAHAYPLYPMMSLCGFEYPIANALARCEAAAGNPVAINNLAWCVLHSIGLTYADVDKWHEPVAASSTRFDPCNTAGSQVETIGQHDNDATTAIRASLNALAELIGDDCDTYDLSTSWESLHVHGYSATHDSIVASAPHQKEESKHNHDYHSLDPIIRMLKDLMPPNPCGSDTSSRVQRFLTAISLYKLAAELGLELAAVNASVCRLMICRLQRNGMSEEFFSSAILSEWDRIWTIGRFTNVETDDTQSLTVPISVAAARHAVATSAMLWCKAPACFEICRQICLSIQNIWPPALTTLGIQKCHGWGEPQGLIDIADAMACFKQAAQCDDILGMQWMMEHGLKKDQQVCEEAQRRAGLYYQDVNTLVNQVFIYRGVAHRFSRLRWSEIAARGFEEGDARISRTTTLIEHAFVLSVERASPEAKMQYDAARLYGARHLMYSAGDGIPSGLTMLAFRFGRYDHPQNQPPGVDTNPHLSFALIRAAVHQLQMRQRTRELGVNIAEPARFLFDAHEVAFARYGILWLGNRRRGERSQMIPRTDLVSGTPGGMTHVLVAHEYLRDVLVAGEEERRLWQVSHEACAERDKLAKRFPEYQFFCS